jgi:hypothetical protein
LIHFFHPPGNGSTLITSSGDAILLSRSDFSSKGSRSLLKYSPKSEMDYGVVACWASNAVGNQKEPCLFHVVPAGNGSVCAAAKGVELNQKPSPGHSCRSIDRKMIKSRKKLFLLPAGLVEC